MKDKSTQNQGYQDLVPESVSEEALSEITGEAVLLTNVQVNQVKASTTELHNSVSGQVSSETFTAENALVGIAHCATLNAQNSMVCLASSEYPTIHGVVGVSIGQETELNDTRTGLIVAREVNGSHIQSVLVVAGNVNGSVEVLADWRSIAVFGAAVGLVVGFVFSVFRAIRGH